MVGILGMVRTPHPIGGGSEIAVRKAHGRLAMWGLLRWIGYAAAAVALAALAFDMWAWRGVGTLNFRSGADWWDTLHGQSLLDFSRFVKGISEAAWKDGIDRALRWPAFATMGVFGLLSMFIGRRRFHT